MPDNIADKPKEPFNWRDYINVSEEMSIDRRLYITGVLDLMFLDENRNGKIDNKFARELAKKIQKRFENNENPITITNEKYSSMEYNSLDSTININYSSLKTSYYIDVDTGNRVPFSLNRALFHEIVHSTITDSDLSSYEEEEIVMGLTNDYMKSFGEPKREYYKAVGQSHTYYLEEPIIYTNYNQSISDFYDLEKLTFNKHSVKIISEEFKREMQELNNSLELSAEELEESRQYFLLNKISLYDALYKEAKAYIDSNGGIKEVLKAEDFNDFMSFLDESDKKKDFDNLMKWNTEMQDLYMRFKDVEAKTPPTTKQIRKMKETESNETGSIDFEDIKIDSLKDSFEKETSVASAISESPQPSPVGNNKEDKYLS